MSLKDKLTDVDVSEWVITDKDILIQVLEVADIEQYDRFKLFDTAKPFLRKRDYLPFLLSKSFRRRFQLFWLKKRNTR